MAPDQKAKHRDRQARESDELVAENVFAGKVGNQLADHAHPRQHHDVHGRVRIEPEQMLEQNRIATGRRIENAYVRQALEGHQQNRDCDHRRAQNHDQAGRVMRPDKQRQAKPGHSRRAHRVNRDDEVQAREN